MKSEATSRFTSRFSSSVIGAPYSQRTPRFTVRSGCKRQSSVAYRSYTVCRRYLSGLPEVIDAVSGTPWRKSAKSEPKASPVKVKVPRGLRCEK